jgi:hypothetical protein
VLLFVHKNAWVAIFALAFAGGSAIAGFPDNVITAATIVLPLLASTFSCCFVTSTAAVNGNPDVTLFPLFFAFAGLPVVAGVPGVVGVLAVFALLLLLAQ